MILVVSIGTRGLEADQQISHDEFDKAFKSLVDGKASSPDDCRLHS